MYLKGTFSAISWIRVNQTVISSPKLFVQENVMWKHLLPDVGFSLQTNEFCSIRVKILRLRLIILLSQLWTLIPDACKFRKLIIWQLILLRGCRVCRNNGKMGWESRTSFLSVEVTWASGRTEIQEWVSVTLWTWVTTPPWLPRERSSVLRLGTEHSTQDCTQPPQKFPLCAPWTSSVTLGEPWTQSLHTWHGIKKGSHED